MADRIDNTRQRRPAADSAMRGDEHLAEDDPLVELARIVASNESFDQILGSRGRAPAQPPRAAQPPRDTGRDVSFDLEAELLNDLHSTFDPAPRAPEPRVAAQRPAAPQPQPQPRAPQPAPRPASRAEEPLRATRGAAPAPRTMPPPPRAAEPVRAGEPPRAPMPARAQPPRAEPFGEVPEFVRAPQPPQARRPAPPRAPEPEPELYAEPAYGDDYLEDEELAGYDDGDGAYDAEPAFEPEPPRRSRKLLITAAVVGVVVLAGAVAVFAIKGRSGVSGGAPQVIAADQSPTKIEPPATEQQPTQDAQQNKLIYDRADPDKGSPATLPVPDANSAASDAAQSNETEASREISRIILPGGPDQGDQPDATADSGESGPRKVRTVVVKPDGTIVSSEAAPRGTTAPSDNAGALPAGSNTAPVVADNTQPPSSDATPMDAQQAQADSSSSAKDGSQLAAPDASAPAAAAAAAPAPAEPAPAASAPADDTAPAAEPAAPAAKTASSGGFVVQITSQRSEAAATAAYKNLQKKFPSVLGNQAPDIAKADLGAKGIYYRVRVGPMSTREEAVNFCEKLRSAGGDCIVQKN